MSEPHKCPVCNGQGTVSKPPYIAGDQASWIASDSRLYPCLACNGTGVIWDVAAPPTDKEE
jgi:DnaJ-class molecular chaperone